MCWISAEFGGEEFEEECSQSKKGMEDVDFRTGSVQAEKWSHLGILFVLPFSFLPVSPGN